jgi:hypothetical protein
MLAFLPIGGGVQVALSNQTVSSIQISGTATAGHELRNNGTAYRLVQTTYTAISGQWLVSGLVANARARYTVVSGSPGGVTFGSWLDLSTTRLVTVSRSTTGTTSGVVDIEIADENDLTNILASARITLSAEIDPF